ncbi:MAG TPA: UDP-N-acetylmuramoyl-L-alanine--D-glutamate ligase [Xanthomonadaceae bacterium]|nr:UDP-N-acetylmuramoyl-L-alanine--D-glutamate ligase [Xanthomonadaceae bacterium]
MKLDELAGLRVAVFGFGREGRSVLALLRRELPGQVPSLFCTPQEAAGVAALDDVDVRTEVPTVDDLAAFDVVVKSPGISPYRTPVAEAMARGTRFTSATALWFAEHPEARVVGVTGSKGKSTTAALIAHLLRVAGRRVALAGNIGLPLTELWRPDPAPDVWVVELSSYQTRDCAALDMAVVTALFPEHLDWHGSVERYFADKLALLQGARLRVLHAGDIEIGRRVAPRAGDLGFGNGEGWHPHGEHVARGTQTFALPPAFALVGVHNRMNLSAALTVVEALGEDAARLLPALASFRALPHRLQPLGERGGREWIDDSIATTPQATLAALEALGERPLALIVGGHDRGLDWAPLVERLRRLPLRAVVCQGDSGPRIAAQLRDELPGQSVTLTADFTEAVAQARAAAGEGGLVLLSPGAPSFPGFRDFSERGRRFAELAGFDVADPLGIGGLGIH